MAVDIVLHRADTFFSVFRRTADRHDERRAEHRVDGNRRRGPDVGRRPPAAILRVVVVVVVVRRLLRPRRHQPRHPETRLEPGGIRGGEDRRIPVVVPEPEMVAQRRDSQRGSAPAPVGQHQPSAAEDGQVSATTPTEFPVEKAGLIWDFFFFFLDLP